jgi:hypothetical protein
MQEFPPKFIKKVSCPKSEHYFRSESTIMVNFEAIMKNNRVWASEKIEEDP